MSFDLTYISLGAGVQSTAVLAMSTLGLHGCPRADVAIFADTGDEPNWVYDHLAVLEPWAAERGVRVERVQKGHLSRQILDHAAVKGDGDRFVTIPAFVEGEDGRGAPLRRQCTREFKIEPIEKRVRALLGAAPGERIAGRKKARALLGISLDEIQRARDNQTPWITNVFPLIDAKIRRWDCERFIAEVGLPVPRKSACVFCPYHSNAFWLDLRDNHPAEWAKAVEFDRKIRRLQTVRGDVFLHRSLKPLDQVRLDDGQGDLFATSCDAGVCGV